MHAPNNPSLWYFGGIIPAVITIFLALKFPLFVSSVTVSPGCIAVTLQLSKTVPPFLMNSDYMNQISKVAS